MKGNVKKLAVFVTVAALSLFVVVATASAGPKDDHALKGQYAFSGPGHCVVSPAGFGDNYIPRIRVCLRLLKYGREFTHSTETVRVRLGPPKAPSITLLLLSEWQMYHGILRIR